MIKYCNNCKHNNNGYCYTAQSCYKYSQFEPIVKNSETKQPDKPTFTKDDLKVGMIVECLDGHKMFIVNIKGFKILYGIDTEESYDLSDWNEDLTDSSCDDYNIAKVYTTNNLIQVLEGNYDSLQLVWKRDAVDWNNVAVDTKILVSGDNVIWYKRHFAKYEDDGIYAFGGGYTSFSIDYKSNIYPWKYAKLYKGDK